MDQRTAGGSPWLDSLWTRHKQMCIPLLEINHSQGITLEKQLAIFLYRCVTGISVHHTGEQFQYSSMLHFIRSLSIYSPIFRLFWLCPSTMEHQFPFYLYCWESKVQFFFWGCYWCNGWNPLYQLWYSRGASISIWLQRPYYYELSCWMWFQSQLDISFHWLKRIIIIHHLCRFCGPPGSWCIKTWKSCEIDWLLCFQHMEAWSTSCHSLNR